MGGGGERPRRVFKCRVGRSRQGMRFKQNLCIGTEGWTHMGEIVDPNERR